MFTAKICFAIHVKNSLKAEGMRGKNIKSEIPPFYFQMFNHFFLFYILLAMNSLESTTVKNEITEEYTTQETTTTTTSTTTTTPCFGACTFEACGWIGDGNCDDAANNLDCNFDGGDCCGPNVNTAYCTGSQVCNTLRSLINQHVPLFSFEKKFSLATVFHVTNTKL